MELASAAEKRVVGRVPKLAAEETRHFALEVAIHADRAAVAAVAERVRAIQGDRPMLLDTQPQV